MTKLYKEGANPIDDAQRINMLETAVNEIDEFLVDMSYIEASIKKEENQEIKEDDYQEQENTEESIEEENTEEDKVSEEENEKEISQEEENEISKIFSSIPETSAFHLAKLVVDDRNNLTIPEITDAGEKIAKSLMKKIISANIKK